MERVHDPEITPAADRAERPRAQTSGRVDAVHPNHDVLDTQSPQTTLNWLQTPNGVKMNLECLKCLVFRFFLSNTQKNLRIILEVLRIHFLTHCVSNTLSRCLSFLVAVLKSRC